MKSDSGIPAHACRASCELLTEDQLLEQPFVRQALSKYAEYLTQRIIDKHNISQQEAKTESSQP